MLTTFLTAVGLCVTIIYVLKHVYTFQIKEYRWDRMRARFEDKGIIAVLYEADFRPPSIKSPRNALILVLSCVLLVGISRLLPQHVMAGVGLIAFAPIIAFVCVSVGVLATALPVALYRKRIVQKAHEIVTYLSPQVIGVTGSYGKSITKDYIHHILSQKYKTAKTPRNQNTAVGVALAVLHHLTRDTQWFVAEMGAYKAGEIAEIADVMKPKIAVITAIGTQHISLFGGKEKLFKAKTEIVHKLPKDGYLFIPDSMDKLIKMRIKRITPCPVVEYQTFPHDPHATALSAAKEVAKKVGFTDQEIEKAIIRIEKPLHVSPQTHPRGHMYIDCSQSSNVEGFISHLHTLKAVHKSKKMVLTSGVIELGAHKKEAYLRILQALPSHTTLYTTDKTFKTLAIGTPQSRWVVHQRSQRALISAVHKALTAETIILVEGRFRPDYLDQIL